MLSILKNVLLLEREQSIASIIKLKDEMNELRKAAEDSETWLGREYSGSNTKSNFSNVDSYGRDIFV